MSDRRPPLRIHVLHHPASERAAEIASGLYDAFVVESGTPGLRIPVRFGPVADDGAVPAPEALALDDAEHAVVVLLIDERMARRVGRGSTAAAWADLVVALLAQAPPGQGPHTVLPVALDAGAFDLDDRLASTSFIRLDVVPPDLQVDDLAFHVSVRALHGLLGTSGAAGAESRAPLELFISHAKADLPRDPALVEGPVRALLAHLAQGPVDHWYDAKDIPPGGRFDREIESGVLESSAVVCVVTDEYSSREWCRREALEAKRAGRPLLVVNALSGAVPRSFPYLGNAPEVRWTEDRDARRVISLVVREALRHQHGLRVVAARASAGDHVIGTAPEALTLASIPAGVTRVLYPDPPLGAEEVEPLSALRPDLALETPLGALTRWDRPPDVDLVGLSLSRSTDIARFGASDRHLATFAEDVALFLLRAGLRIGYGGVIGHGDPSENYVEQLIGVARSHSPRGREIGAGFQPIVNYVGWPVHLRYGDEEYRVYGREADLIEVDPPADLGLEIASLEPDEQGFVPPTAEDPALAARRRYAWGRAMTEMRRRMTGDVAARLVAGGRLSGYVGVVPGVVEEALLSLRAGQPIYLAGAFGGAARLVIDALAGEGAAALTTDAFRAAVPGYDAALAVYAEHGQAAERPEAIAAELAELGRGGLAGALHNGLDEDENRELSTSTDPLRLVELVLTGLERRSEQPDG